LHDLEAVVSPPAVEVSLLEDHDPPVLLDAATLRHVVSAPLRASFVPAGWSQAGQLVVGLAPAVVTGEPLFPLLRLV
jgi:hypothetical protein